MKPILCAQQINHNINYVNNIDSNDNNNNDENDNEKILSKI